MGKSSAQIIATDEINKGNITDLIIQFVLEECREFERPSTQMNHNRFDCVSVMKFGRMGKLVSTTDLITF